MKPISFFSALARRNGIKPATFYNRCRRGWPPCRAAMTPARAYFYEWGAA